MLVTQDNTRQIFKAYIGTDDLALRAFTAINEPFQILIRHQCRGHIALQGGNSRRRSQERDVKRCTHRSWFLEQSNRVLEPGKTGLSP